MVFVSMVVVVVVLAAGVCVAVYGVVPDLQNMREHGNMFPGTFQVKQAHLNNLTSN